MRDISFRANILFKKINLKAMSHLPTKRETFGNPPICIDKRKILPRANGLVMIEKDSYFILTYEIYQF